MILYLHGFNSSPQSFKGSQTQQYFAENFPECTLLMPQIPVHAQPAINFLEDIYIKNQSFITGIIGSSLGGYLASYFVEKYSVKSVLVNPAVRPFELLETVRGVQTNPYTLEQFELTQADMQALISVDTPVITRPDNYWLLQQKGDEVLDYRQAVAKYAQCRQTVEEGGEHVFVGYDRFLPEIAQFLGVSKG